MTQDNLTGSIAPDDAETPSSQSRGSTRQRSQIAFTYDDLDTAVNVVQTIHHRFGGQCDYDQAAGALGQRRSSGAFNSKIGAARRFGLVTTDRAGIQITGLGQRILSETTERDAKVQAFLSVPLYERLFRDYSGTQLPSATGLEAKLDQLGVPEKQLRTARQVFMRSAQQAGFFEVAGDRLIRPGVASVSGESQETDGKDDDEPSDEEDGQSVMTDPLITGLLKRLPDPKDGFDEEERKLWLSTLEMNLAYIYSKPKNWVFERPNPGATPDATQTAGTDTAGTDGRGI